MIKDEIRIGNYVYKLYGSRGYVIDIVNKSTFTGSTRIKPILLNEFNFSKCEEIKNIAGAYYISLPNLKAELHLVVYKKKVTGMIKSDFCELVLDELKSLHQLQNLYFSLTNKELTIK